MRKIRKAHERGHANHGWLDTYHTFSFNTYYDPNHMGYRSLRVINEDRVEPGRGFGTHSHRDMEIISYVLEGALAHKDSVGNGSVIRPGDVQRMSAGTGIYHSEFNDSEVDPVHFLQIWIIPREKGIEPSYEEASFSRRDRLGRLRLIASPDGSEGSVTINQDAKLYASVLDKGMSIGVPVPDGRHLWIQVARGGVASNETRLAAGDGLAIAQEGEVTLTASEDSELLIFDLA